MQQFLRDNQEYWGGIHRELGLLIYDLRDQQHLAAEKVRLYVVAERRRATFMKDLVRAKLVALAGSVLLAWAVLGVATAVLVPLTGASLAYADLLIGQSLGDCLFRIRLNLVVRNIGRRTHLAGRLRIALSRQRRH